MMEILVLNGPNLNLLGMREPEIYGNRTYKDLEKLIEYHCKMRKIHVKIKQTNHEGLLVDYIQEAFFDQIDGIIINPAAYTHTSVAILDALKAVKIPCVEVHISNPDEREAYRQVSYVREACLATIKGKGLEGYLEAIDKLISYI